MTKSSIFAASSLFCFCLELYELRYRACLMTQSPRTNRARYQKITKQSSQFWNFPIFIFREFWPFFWDWTTKMVWIWWFWKAWSKHKPVTKWKSFEIWICLNFNVGENSSERQTFGRYRQRSGPQDRLNSIVRTLKSNLIHKV